MGQGRPAVLAEVWGRRRWSSGGGPEVLGPAQVELGGAGLWVGAGRRLGSRWSRRKETGLLLQEEVRGNGERRRGVCDRGAREEEEEAAEEKADSSCQGLQLWIGKSWTEKPGRELYSSSTTLALSLSPWLFCLGGSGTGSGSALTRLLAVLPLASRTPWPSHARPRELI